MPSILVALLMAAVQMAAEGTAARPLVGNKPCPYPPAAQKAYVAGPVRFVAQVRPDGTPDSVSVEKVPASGLGFEEAIRACILQWRFEPAAAGDTALRTHRGRMRFRLDATEEAAIRALLESVVSAWNARDMRLLEGVRVPLQGERPSGPGRLELEADLEKIHFLEPTAVNVRQVARQIGEAPPGAPGTADDAVLDAYAVKGPGGWRLVSLTVGKAVPAGPMAVGGQIQEPRKVKNVPPVYPETMKAARMQGAVILEALITPSGKIVAVKVLRGVHPHLDAAALTAVRQWEYTPTLFQGVPVPVIMTVVVNFRLS